MRTIVKGREPPSLREHREGGGTYANYTRTDDLRSALLRDQGHICCYCMRRIQVRAMKIEHWASQSENEERTVDWKNVLGACTGGDGERKALQHCDTARGNTPLHVNPLDRKRPCEGHLRYLANGEIFSDDPDIYRDVNATLKLNLDSLNRSRLQVHDVLMRRLTEEKPDYWDSSMLEAELKLWKRRDKQGMFREYCQVAIYFLEKAIRKRKK